MDLTLDTNDSSHNFTPIMGYWSSRKYGYISIVPRTVTIKGYSTNGITSDFNWNCDLDVHEFPAGTKFWMKNEENFKIPRNFKGKFPFMYDYYKDLYYKDFLTKKYDSYRDDDQVPLTVEDGFIKNISGHGIRVIKYQLPADSLPTSGSWTKYFTYHIIPHSYPNSFSSDYDIKDLGLDKPSDFDTSTSGGDDDLLKTYNNLLEKTKHSHNYRYKILLKRFIARNGDYLSKHKDKDFTLISVPGWYYKNNNWSMTYWHYDPGQWVGYRVERFLPRHSDKPLFDPLNVYWDNTMGWYDNGSCRSSTFDRTFVENNDSYQEFDFNFGAGYGDAFFRPAGTIGVAMGFDKSDALEFGYNQSIPVVVKYDGEMLDPKYYHIWFRHADKAHIRDFNMYEGASKWVEMNAPNNDDFNQVAVTFEKDAYKLVNNKALIQIMAPFKIASHYDRDTLSDNDYSVEVFGAPISPVSDNSDLVKNSPFNWRINPNFYTISGARYTDNLLLYKGAKVEVSNEIKPLDSSAIYDDDSKSFRANFESNVTIHNPLILEGYKVTRQITFDPIYDMDTLDIKDLDGYTMTKEGHVVTLTKKLDLDNYKPYTSTLKPFDFSIDTLPNLLNKPFTGGVTEKVTVDCPKVGSFDATTVSDTSRASYRITGLGVSSIGITSPKLIELGDTAEFRIVASGGDRPFRFPLYLSNTGDNNRYTRSKVEKVHINAINKANGSDIDIENREDSSHTMDGYGESSYDGSNKYTIKLNGLKNPGQGGYYHFSFWDYSLPTAVYNYGDLFGQQYSSSGGNTLLSDVYSGQMARYLTLFSSPLFLGLSNDHIADYAWDGADRKLEEDSSDLYRYLFSSVYKEPIIKNNTLSVLSEGNESNRELYKRMLEPYHKGFINYLGRPSYDAAFSEFLNGRAPLTTYVSNRGSEYQSYTADMTVSVSNPRWKKGDTICIWPGAVTTSDDTPVSRKNVAVSKIPWPGWAKVVVSTISGKVTKTFGNNKEGINNARVDLYKVDDEGKKSLLDIAHTNSEGEYKFDNLRHGNYVVTIPVEYNDDMTVKTDSKNALPQDYITNRFGVKEPARLTTKADIPIVLGIDSDSKSNDFNYEYRKSDLEFDMHPATISDSRKYTNVGFDMEIKNTGNSTLSGLKLTDLLSSDAKNVSASINYKKVVSKFSGRDARLLGNMPSFGEFVLSNNNYYSIQWNNGDPQITKIDGIDGKIIDMATSNFRDSLVATDTGCYYINKGDYGFSVKRLDGIEGNITHVLIRAVSTDKGLYFINSDRTEGSSPTVTKVDGIGGNVKQIVSSNYKIGASTGRDYYVFDWNDGDPKVTKASGINGDIEQVIGQDPSSVGLLTTTGYYLCKRDNENYTFIKVGGIEGNIKQVVGASPADNSRGSGVVTDNGYYLVDYNNGEPKAVKVDGIDGNIKMISGLNPLFSSDGSAVATDKGYYIVDYNRGLPSVVKVGGIDGNIKNILAARPLAPDSGSTVVTDKGLYIIDWNRGDPRVTRVNGIEGNIRQLLGIMPMHFGLAVLTDKGYYMVEYNGGSPKATLLGYSEVLVKGQDLVPVSTTNGNNDITTREYLLPDLEPRSTILLHMNGVLLKKEVEYLIGHEAYLTSSLTPRSGITTSKVTGENKSPGIPDDFVLPSMADYDPNGIKNNPTVMLNSSIDSEGEADDLADQVPAKIPALAEEDKPIHGVVEGKAFYDANNDGILNDNIFLSKLHVTLTNQDGITIGDTLTDGNGYYKFSDVSEGTYDLHFDIGGFRYNNEVTEPTKLDVSSLDLSNDIDYSGYNHTALVLTRGNSHAVRNLGLKTVNASISVIKGFKANNTDTVFGDRKPIDKVTLPDTINLDLVDSQNGRIDDGDNDSRTQAYVFKVFNTGNASVTNVSVKDTTLKGLDAKVYTNLRYVNGKATKEVSLHDDGVIYDGDNPLIMAPGSYVYGGLDIGFDKTHTEHKDELLSNAVVMSGDGHKLSSIVTSKDSLEVNYAYKEDTSIDVDLWGVADADSKDHEDLDGCSFKLYKKVGDGYKYIGVYATNHGHFSLKLPDGDYKFVQLNTEFGYVLPSDDGWFLTIKNNNLSVKAGYNMPYSKILNNNTVVFYNYRNRDLPLTGGDIRLISYGFICLFGGSGLIFILKRKSIRE